VHGSERLWRSWAPRLATYAQALRSMTLPAPGSGSDEAQFTITVLRNAFDVWFEPEIKRRQEAGTLPKPFSLWAAQVLMELGKSPVIRFNDQIRGVLKARADSDTKLPIQQGSELRLADLGEIVGLQLTGEEANAGHLTAIFHKGTWYLLFDFRYNAARIARHLEVAEQFLSAAETALAKRHRNASLENLYAAVELTAKCYLLMLPDERLLAKTRHRFVATEFNRHGGQHGNVDASFVDLLNRLAAIRTKARFPDEPFEATESDIGAWLTTARSMLADLDSRRPRRYGDDATTT